MKKFFIILGLSIAAHPTLLGMQSSFLQRNKYAITVAAGVASIGGLGCLAYKNPEKVMSSLQGFQGGLIANISSLSQTVQNVQNSFSTALKNVGSTYKNAGLYCALVQAMRTKMGITTGIFGMTAIAVQLQAWGIANYNKKQEAARKAKAEQERKKAARKTKKEQEKKNEEFNNILNKQEGLVFKHDIESFNVSNPVFDLMVWQSRNDFWKDHNEFKFILSYLNEDGEFEETSYTSSRSSILSRSSYITVKQIEKIGCGGDWIKYIGRDLITIGSSLIEGEKIFEKRKIGKRLWLITQCQRNSIDLTFGCCGYNDILVVYVDNNDRGKYYFQSLSTLDTKLDPEAYRSMKEDILQLFFQKGSHRLIIVMENTIEILLPRTVPDEQQIGKIVWDCIGSIKKNTIPNGICIQDYITMLENNDNQNFDYKIDLKPNTLSITSQKYINCGYIAVTKSGDFIYCPKLGIPLLLKKRAGAPIIWGLVLDQWCYMALLEDGNFVRIVLPIDWKYAAEKLRPHQANA